MKLFFCAFFLFDLRGHLYEPHGVVFPILNRGRKQTLYKTEQGQNKLAGFMRMATWLDLPPMLLWPFAMLVSHQRTGAKLRTGKS
jgi:hypothetical protein